jgi:Zn-dependent peptidase ImmA (M78 family)
VGVHTNRGFKRAREERESLELAPDRPLPDALEAVEDLGGAHVVLLDLGAGVAGAHLVRPGCPLLFVNGRQPAQRQRFTLAHEFGHHRLGHASVVDRPQVLNDAGHDPLEVEANAFAAEFLMPRAALDRWAAERRPSAITLEDVVRLAAEYGVSSQMTRYRLAAARILRDSSRAEKLDREIAAGDHLTLAAYLDLSAPQDRLARSAGLLPRIPAPLRAGPLGRLLAGELDADGLARELGLDRAAVRRMLENFGLDALAAAV